jgi:hypothetical protein
MGPPIRPDRPRSAPRCAPVPGNARRCQYVLHAIAPTVCIARDLMYRTYSQYMAISERQCQPAVAQRERARGTSRLLARSRGSVSRNHLQGQPVNAEEAEEGEKQQRPARGVGSVVTNGRSLIGGNTLKPADSNTLWGLVG